ncbi:hypothetical protein [Heyndrickxia camelliae]|uniref:hypothetical protein n=1 Tax=Heyndrickxia camelliae TaxID=1707093 RepID=UPI0013FDC214|nr:hypothetical protein [Heyndrickxia camelliae]
MRISVSFQMEIDQLKDVDRNEEEICQVIEQILDIGSKQCDVYIDEIISVKVLER